MEGARLTILVKGSYSTIYAIQEEPEGLSDGFSLTGFYNETFAYFLKNDLPVWRKYYKKITVNFLDYYSRETLAIIPLHEETEHDETL